MDPIDAESDGRLAFLLSSEAILDLRKKRLGLVLAGGGAKGAYQAGALQALNELGLNRFHVVTGTSVGALNAAAASAGRISEAVGYWRQLSLRQVVTAALEAKVQRTYSPFHSMMKDKLPPAAV